MADFISAICETRQLGPILSGDIGVDDLLDIAKVLLEKRVTQAPAGIGEHRIERPPDLDIAQMQLVDAGYGGEVGFHGHDLDPELAKPRGRIMDVGASETISRSEPCSAATLASSNPMSEDAPVTREKESVSSDAILASTCKS